MLNSINAGDIVEILFREERIVVNVLDVYDNFIRVLEGFILPHSDYKLVKILSSSRHLDSQLKKMDIRKNEMIEVEFIDYVHEDESVKYLLFNSKILHVKKEKLPYVKNSGNSLYFKGCKINKNQILSLNKRDT